MLALNCSSFEMVSFIRYENVFYVIITMAANIVTGEDVSMFLSVLLGNDITIPCHILPVEETPLVLWEKVWPLPEFELLTYNDRTTNNSKYITTRNNSLIIRHVTLRDEGIYQCQIGDVKYQVGVNVSVSMADLELTYDGSLPFITGTAVALICRSTHSRPPADLRWYHGLSEVTSKSSKTLKRITDENGFGNSEGILSVIIQDDQSDIPYRCIADLPGQHTVKTVFLFPLTTSSAAVMITKWYIWMTFCCNVITTVLAY